ncbi:hypothetical protein PUNSTDRAFT_128910 [Punctularia strigosozonata HHB-11173 SS5]|uniref:uncharacterized protein n=1 Tax=Punctularia strigosozonata (strain HHB-11173) TaxID=741275 RepID=UPI00044180FC|nr:uncharacterized protein PUNSTDRAFT_128910 [Punctularia strigosozonata HHB-11173 SS5]EIN13221.1 hypothetical protein PUNSTDRAFT_128910 [Punctularia strigosozonata HHB-11173 SS5]
MRSAFTRSMDVYFEHLHKANDALFRAIKTSACNKTPVLEAIESWLAESQLEDKRFFLEFVLGSLDEVASAFLGKFFEENFPTNAGEYFTGTWSRLLSCLSANLCILVDSSDDTSRDLNRRVTYVSSANTVLERLSSPTEARFSDTHAARQSGKQKAPKTDGSLNFSRKGKGRAPSTFDTIWGPVAPTNDYLEALRDLGISSKHPCEPSPIILQELKRSLLVYLEVVRWPDVQDALKQVVGDGMAANTVRGGNHDPGPAPHAARTVGYERNQPTNSAIYFDHADGFGDWWILISGRTEKMLRETTKKDPTTFAIIVNKIKDLSHGHFSRDNQRPLTAHTTDVPIYAAWVTGDLRLVYHIGCIPDIGTERERQVIKVFGIYTHAQLDQRFWSAVGTYLAEKGHGEFKNRCTYRVKPRSNGDDVFSPGFFPSVADSAKRGGIPELVDVADGYHEELSSLLVFEKYAALSQAFLNDVLKNKEVVHPYLLSAQEQEIVNHPYSCYVIGRSGTGKTTVMLFKMFAVESNWRTDQYSGVTRPRQIFLTQSRILAEKVAEYFAKLSDSLTSNASSPRSPKYSKLPRDADHMNDLRNDLPRRFSQLRDEHFPLFVTYSMLCSMVEADYLTDEVHETRQARHSENLVWTVKDQQERPNFISLREFVHLYWAHFPSSLRKGIDPALVWNEFMGVIKGSEQAHLSERHILDKESYLNLSARSCPTFAQQRDVVYELFERYEEKRIRMGHRDAADRTHCLLGFLRRGIRGKKIDFLYVDEVQDNLLIEILLLRMLCANPHGLVLAGDTAQTISAGSSFRFNDIKAFLHRNEERSRSNSLLSIAVPQPHPMAGFILRDTQSIVELITRLWPYAIDALDPERALVDGIKPIFFHGEISCEQFFRESVGELVEFGADQCVLVRNDAALRRLRSDVGDIGTIMTIYDSKGLEFNDVLIYNFFEDSHVRPSTWRVILNVLGSGGCAVPSAHKYEESKHAGLCNELKALYVAVTRARRNLWIVDCSESAEPFRLLWSRNGLIQTFDHKCGLNIPALAVVSTADDWAKKARSLFENRRYHQAADAFRRAGLVQDAAVSRAHCLRDDAYACVEATTTMDHARRRKALVEAAEAFVACVEHAATIEKQTCYREAARCYVGAKDEAEAARLYLEAEDHTDAARHFHNAGMLDKAVDVILTHQVEPATHNKIVDDARFQYLKAGKLKKASRLFESKKDLLEYLTTHDFTLLRAKLLKTMGRVSDAADTYLAGGRPLEAISLLLADSSNSGLFHRGLQCLLAGLWKSHPLGTNSQKSKLLLEEYLRLSDRIDNKYIDQHVIHMISMFRAIADGDNAHLKQLRHELRDNSGDKAAILLCLDSICNDETVQTVATATPAQILSTLGLYREYAQSVRDLLPAEFETHIKPEISQLFGLQARGASAFLVPSNAYIHKKLKSQDRLLVHGNERDGTIVSSQSLLGCIQTIMDNRLMIRITSPAVARHAIARDSISRRTITHGFTREFNYICSTQLLCKEYLGGQTKNGFLVSGMSWVCRLYDTLFPAFPALGSASDLSPFFASGSESGLFALRDFIRDALQRLDPGSSSLNISDIVKIYYLAALLNYEAAKGYVQSCPSCLERLPILRHFTAFHIAWFDPLSHLALFLSYLQNNHVEVDVSVWCNLIEDLCKCACLLGYNMDSPPLRKRILNAVATQGSSKESFPACDQYLQAKSWSHLDQAMFQVQLEPRDPLVQLCLEGEHLPDEPPPGVQRLVYRTVREISQLLGPDIVPLAFPHNEAEESSPAPSSSGERNSVDHPVQDHDDSIDVLEHQEGATTIVKSEDHVEDVNIGSVTKALLNTEGGDALPTPPADSVSMYLEHSKKMGWPDSIYRVLYLGPVPQLDTCLKHVIKWANGIKQELQARVATTDNVDSREALMLQQADAYTSRKQAERLRRYLRPTADIHTRRDLERLKELARDVEAFIASIPADSVETIRSEVDRAVQVIIAAALSHGQSQSSKQESSSTGVMF